MKKLEKMSLANMVSKLTRKEMKNIMAGSNSSKKCGRCDSAYDCGSGCNACSSNSCYTFK